MKTAKDRREEFNDLARKDNILGRNKTQLELWEEHLKSPIVALQSPEVRRRSVLKWLKDLWK